MSALTSQASVFRNIERKIGGLMEGAFGRTFRSSVQPVELARKLAKEMDDHRTISIHRVYVPNQYTVHLNPADREQFAAYEAQMSAELEEYLVEHARREGYSIATRPLVRLGERGGSVGGDVRDLGRHRRGGRRAAPGRTPDEPAPVPEPAVDPGQLEIPDLPPPPVEAAIGGATMVYAAEPPSRPGAEQEERALLQWEGQSIALTSPVTTIGRSSDCQIVLTDPNVSRRHAEIRRIGEGYSLIDLGSTNGTEVNGQHIAETALMNGDVIGVGQTQLTFERRLG